MTDTCLRVKRVPQKSSLLVVVALLLSGDSDGDGDGDGDGCWFGSTASRNMIKDRTRAPFIFLYTYIFNSR